MTDEAQQVEARRLTVYQRRVLPDQSRPLQPRGHLMNGQGSERQREALARDLAAQSLLQATDLVAERADGEVLFAGLTNPKEESGDGPAGTYSARIQPLSPNHGVGFVSITIDCPGADPDEEVEFGIYIDPSGRVVDTAGTPIQGATVTLLRADVESPATLSHA